MASLAVSEEVLWLSGVPSGVLGGLPLIAPRGSLGPTDGTSGIKSTTRRALSGSLGGPRGPGESQDVCGDRLWHPNAPGSPRWPVLKHKKRNHKTIRGFKVKLVMVRSSAAPHSSPRAKQAGVHALLGGPLDPKNACTPSQGLVQPTPHISECKQCLIVNYQKTC